MDVEKEVIEAEQVVPEAVPSRPEARTGTTVHPSQLPTALPQHLIMGDRTSSGETLLSHLTAIRQLALPQDLASGILIQQEFYKRALQQQILLSMITNSKLVDRPSTTVEIAQRVEAPAEGTQSPDLGMILASPTDAMYLNPIHCFVRRHVEFFVADKEDVAAPSPGRKTRILLGQVGIRCVHCAKMPLKKRVKRAYCYPQSVNGIYHAVSNMKFDHFSKCSGLSDLERTEFVHLRLACARRGSGGGQAATQGMANSTAQYYHDSALRMGLVDTSGGIRFADQVVHNHQQSIETTCTLPNLDDKKPTATIVPMHRMVANDGLSALVIAATEEEPRSWRESSEHVEKSAKKDKQLL